MERTRKLPRPFTMHWGSGRIVEEVAFAGEHHEPCIQLLEYDEGEATGSYSIRFCYYNLDGRFQRSPMMLGPDTLDGLRDALRGAPRLRALLRRLVR
jgi:hypothetical protein